MEAMEALELFKEVAAKPPDERREWLKSFFQGNKISIPGDYTEGSSFLIDIVGKIPEIAIIFGDTAGEILEEMTASKMDFDERYWSLADEIVWILESLPVTSSLKTAESLEKLMDTFLRRHPENFRHRLGGIVLTFATHLSRCPDIKRFRSMSAAILYLSDIPVPVFVLVSIIHPEESPKLLVKAVKELEADHSPTKYLLLEALKIANSAPGLKEKIVNELASAGRNDLAEELLVIEQQLIEQ